MFKNYFENYFNKIKKNNFPKKKIPHITKIFAVSWWDPVYPNGSKFSPILEYVKLSGRKIECAAWIASNPPEIPRLKK